MLVTLKQASNDTVTAQALYHRVRVNKIKPAIKGSNTQTGFYLLSDLEPLVDKDYKLSRYENSGKYKIKTVKESRYKETPAFLYFSTDLINFTGVN